MARNPPNQELLSPSIFEGTCSNWNGGASTLGQSDTDVAPSPFFHLVSGAEEGEEEEEKTHSVCDVVGIGRGVQCIEHSAPRDCSEELYTLVNGVTQDVDGDISLEALPLLTPFSSWMKCQSPSSVRP